MTAIDTRPNTACQGDSRVRAGSLWLTKSGLVVMVHNIIYLDGRPLVTYSYSDTDNAELKSHPLATWHKELIPHQPLTACVRSVHASYQLILMSIEEKIKNDVLLQLGDKGAGYSQEFLNSMLESIEKISTDLSYQAGSVIEPLFGHTIGSAPDAFPELAFESISRLALIYDAIHAAARQPEFSHSFDILSAARSGESCCTEAVGFAALATNLIKLQIALGRAAQSEYEDLLADVMTWPLIGFPSAR
ncbi:hypothetical protein ACV1C4_23370 [Aeromonas hydrophila]